MVALALKGVNYRRPWPNGRTAAAATSRCVRILMTHDHARERRRVNREMARLAILGGMAAAAIAACGSGNVGGLRDGPEVPPNQAPPRGGPTAQLPSPGKAWVIFGADTIVAEVASVPEEREKGLMGRVAVPDGTGMLFVFPRSAGRYLWMKDTQVPLSVAIFDDNNRIGAIRHLEPLDETLVDSEIATALLLEVRQGWFAENGIAVGATAEVVFGPGLTVR